MTMVGTNGIAGEMLCVLLGGVGTNTGVGRPCCGRGGCNSGAGW